MRKEIIEVDSIVHVYNRGNRKQEIVRDEHDRWRFLQLLYYFNSQESSQHMLRELKITLGLKSHKKLIWPKEWPKRNKLVEILGFVLRKNHYHLILKEIKKGGIATFMQKFGTAVTMYFNTKYKEVGRLFQGPYKFKCVKSDHYLTCLISYINIKNIFELYPGGIEKAMKKYNEAFEFACNYEYGSLKAYAFPESETAKIIDKDALLEILGESTGIFSNIENFKKMAMKNIELLDFDESALDLTLSRTGLDNLAGSPPAGGDPANGL